MRILFLAKKPPYPVKDGESIAIAQLIEGFLEAGHSVDLLYMETPKHSAEVEKFVSGYADKFRHQGVFVDTSINVRDVLVNLITGTSYHLDRFLSETYPQILAEWLQSNQYDIVQLEGLYLAPYVPIIRKYSDAIVAMRAHNVESQIWERLTKQLPFGPKKFYLRIQVKRMHRFELNNLNIYDLMIPITKSDADTFREAGCKIPIHVCPAGFDLKKWETAADSKFEKSVYHLGALDWLPNIEGIEWFLNEVWPEVRKKHPTAQFFLAGRNFPKQIKGANQRGVQLIGEVEDAVAFVKDKPVMITPLFSGSGMRIKIVEGMAAGKAIVSTSIGAEGIDYKDGENICIADNQKAFAEAIIQLLNKHELTQKLGKNAREFALKHYDSHKFASELMAFYRRHL